MREFDVVVVGAGPAGIFTALELQKGSPNARVLIVDAGSSIDRRNCPARRTGKCVGCTPCAIMQGWAGAGAFSDGKLSLSEEVGGNLPDYLPRQQVRELIHYCDEQYLAFGAPDIVHGRNDPKVEEFKYEASKYNIQLVPCPVRHMGTEYSFEVLRAMYRKLCESENFTFQEYTTCEDVVVEDDQVVGAVLKTRDGKVERIGARFVVAAPGRAGASWLTRVAHAAGIHTQNNEVDIGVRVEVPNAVMDHLTKHLYEAKLVYYCDTFENKVRTFCMNPGGLVSEEHYDGRHRRGQRPLLRGRLPPHGEHELRHARVDASSPSRLISPPSTASYIAQLGNMLTGGGIMVQRLGDLLKGRRTDASRLKKSTTIPTLPTAVPGDLLLRPAAPASDQHHRGHARL